MGRAANEDFENQVINGTSEVHVTEGTLSLKELSVNGSSPGVNVFTDAKLVSSKAVEVTFGDSSTWFFHSSWLLDACRAQLDQGNNRNATLSAVTAHYFNGGKEISTEATEVSLTESKAGLKVTWEGGFGDTFSHAFLRSYAPIVGKCISEEQPEYFTHNPLNAEFENDLWDRDTLDLPIFQWDDLKSEGEQYEKLCHAVVNPGVALVRGLPEDEGATGEIVTNAMFNWFGKMMQHPERDTNHWLISTMDYSKGGNSQGYDLENVKKNPAYNTDLRLLNHTDQVSYGGPGFLLAFHCVAGQGVNSICDGFKVAQVLREQYPNYFKMLTKPTSFGRRIAHYRQPIDQHVLEPVITLDSYGNVMRVRYNEILRGPIPVPFEDFEEYYAATKKFVELCNADEYNVERTLEKGDLIIFNNWRAMHGRKSAAKGRIIVGGTIAMESFKSKMRLVFDKKADPETLKDRIGVPEAVLAHQMGRKELAIIR